METWYHPVLFALLGMHMFQTKRLREYVNAYGRM